MFACTASVTFFVSFASPYFFNQPPSFCFIPRPLTYLPFAHLRVSLQVFAP